MKLKMTAGLFILILMATACSTAEIPVFDTSSLADEARADAEVAIVATQTAIANQPTATPEPTDMPVEETEEIVETEEVEADATAEVAEGSSETDTTEEVASASGNPAENDPLFAAISSADIANGEMLFSMMAVPACSTCHYADTDTQLVGPGQHNVLNRTIERIENGTIDEPGPYTYLYNSIINPGDYITEGFPNAMGDVYEGVMTEQQIYDLVAYLASLGD